MMDEGEASTVDVDVGDGAVGAGPGGARGARMGEPRGAPTCGGCDFEVARLDAASADAGWAAASGALGAGA